MATPDPHDVTRPRESDMSRSVGAGRYELTREQMSDALVGDELVPEPKWSYTLGIAIDASPEDVWPWIAQIGQRRGGFYSYQTLENLAGCRITNTAEILYWCYDSETAVWNNRGDTVYLFDAEGNPVAVQSY